MKARPRAESSAYRRLPKSMIHVVVAIVMSAALAAQGPPSAGGERVVGWWGDLFTDPRVPLSAVARAPEGWRGRSVRFDVTLRECVPHPGGLFTSLQSENHVAFAGWPDEAPLWKKDVWDAPIKTLFAAKGSEAERAMRRAGRYGRVAVTARVVEVFGHRPWILVTAATVLDGRFDDAGLASLVKAFTLKEHRRYEAAADVFARSARPEWPASGRKLALLEEGRCLALAGRRDEGAVKLVAALAVDDDPAVRAELAAMRTDKAPASRPAPESRPSP